MKTLIRPITEFAELQRCVALQQLVWGSDFTELVPAAILWVATRTGGLVAGAFDEQDNLLGFVFGLTGLVGGRPIHWSDMLAVHPRARGTGIGRSLKHFQRDVLLSRGITEVNWTFDPLESRNAHLNFARLGITSREYIVDAYGQSSSHLHTGLGTDRLIASWSLESDRVRTRMAGGPPPPEAAFMDGPVINPHDEPLLALTDPRLRLRIPADIQAIKRSDPAGALRWRATTRAAFTAYFARGYEAADFIRGSSLGGDSYYVLVRAEP